MRVQEGIEGELCRVENSHFAGMRTYFFAEFVMVCYVQKEKSVCETGERDECGDIC